MTAALQADATKLPLADESVDLIVTSPPYFALRSYQDGGEHYDGQIGSEDTPDEWVKALMAVTDECWRVLKPTGSMFVNLGDKYSGSGGYNANQLGGHVQRGPARYNQAAGRARPKSLMGTPWRYAIACIDAGWILRAEIIWDKPNGIPESVTDRVRKTHEQWFHFTKEERYFESIDHLRVRSGRESTWEEYEAAKQHKWSGANEISGRNEMVIPVAVNHPLGRVPGSVWSITSEAIRIPADVQERLGLTKHYAAFPQEWPRRLINGWCPEGGTVLDPFGGTGTTAMVAHALGRTGISVDLSADYTRLARWRIFESGHAEKSVTATAKERAEALPEVLSARAAWRKEMEKLKHSTA